MPHLTMSSSGRRRFVVRRHPVVVADVGCGCRLPKLPSFLTSLPIKTRPQNPKPLFRPFSPSTSTSTTNTTSTMNAATTATTTTTSSSSPSVAAFESPRKRGAAAKTKTKTKTKTKKAEEGVAVVKESSDPYVDFRESMMQMIVEMEMYSWEDLRDLLHRFLALNSPYHHHLILRAFAEIWAAGALSPPSPSPSISAAAAAAAAARR